MASSCSKATKEGKKGGKLITVMIWVTVVLILCSLAALGYRIWTQSKSGTLFTAQAPFWDQQTPLSLTFCSNGVEFVGTLSRDDAGLYLFTLTEPKQLAGFSLQYDSVSGESLAAYEGILATLPKLSLPQQSIPLLAGILEQTLTQQEKEQGILQEFSGEIAGYSYLLTTDRQSGRMRLSIPKLQLECDLAVLVE